MDMKNFEDCGIYECTVVLDRYGGSYSRGKWTAWNCNPSEVPREIEANDNECTAFWNDFKGLVGKGDQPELAVVDLIKNKFSEVNYRDEWYKATKTECIPVSLGELTITTKGTSGVLLDVEPNKAYLIYGIDNTVSVFKGPGILVQMHTLSLEEGVKNVNTMKELGYTIYTCDGLTDNKVMVGGYKEAELRPPLNINDIPKCGI